MKVDLEKKDLIHLVTGISPYYSLFEELTASGAGVYCGGFSEHWEWNKPKLEKMSEEKLFELYGRCKDSWR